MVVDFVINCALTMPNISIIWYFSELRIDKQGTNLLFHYPNVASSLWIYQPILSKCSPCGWLSNSQPIVNVTHHLFTLLLLLFFFFLLLSQHSWAELRNSDTNPNLKRRRNARIAPRYESAIILIVLIARSTKRIIVVPMFWHRVKVVCCLFAQFALARVWNFAPIINVR